MMLNRCLFIVDKQRKVKVVVLGSAGVGKSSIIQRYCKGNFESKAKATIGVDFYEKRERVRDSSELITLQIWDTAGQEVYRSLNQLYYRGSSAVIFIFDSTSQKSLMELNSWVDEFLDKMQQELGGNNDDSFDR
jgi:small GTP-binding protein